VHLGNARTALLAWLWARAVGGRFLLRLEDLDAARVRAGAAERQLADLAALGLDWDGEPVRQSERHALYADALARLEADGLLYPCWCTRAEIRQAASAPHGPLPEGFYPGTCRNLTDAERADRERSGRPPALRLDAQAQEIAFEDLLHGETRGVVDDFVLWRGDGTPAYQLAVVVDDAGQGVDQVVRGDDLIDSTPRQILLQRLLGQPEPTYVHVPLVLGPDGQRLAKRHGAVTLEDMTADRALAWIGASLNIALPLLENFDPERLPREPSTWLT
jgi:glutamyl-tRNA synthetase